jgi:hypothetical protein
MKRGIRIKIKYILIKIISLELIAGLLVSPDPVFAATLNPGSNWTLCTGLVEMTQSDPNHPTLAFHWTFTSYQSDYNDGVPPPNNPNPALSAATQSAIRIQVDDDPNFLSVNADSGWYTTSGTSYSTTSPTLYYNNTYYWRMAATDNYSSVSDWANGGAFTTYKSATLLRGVRFR